MYIFKYIYIFLTCAGNDAHRDAFIAKFTMTFCRCIPRSLNCNGNKMTADIEHHYRLTFIGYLKHSYFIMESDNEVNDIIQQIQKEIGRNEIVQISNSDLDESVRQLRELHTCNRIYLTTRNKKYEDYDIDLISNGGNGYKKTEKMQ